MSGDYKDGKLAELWRGPRTAAGEGWVSKSLPARTSERADSGSCSGGWLSNGTNLVVFVRQLCGDA